MINIQSITVKKRSANRKNRRKRGQAMVLFRPMCTSSSRLIERLQEYLSYSKITAYAFEHSCGLSNGYLGKQLKGKGSVGSEILERIKAQYTDLSLVWLVTGKGQMLLPGPAARGQSKQPDVEEEERVLYASKDEVIKLLTMQVARLEDALSDKERIIRMFESR